MNTVEGKYLGGLSCELTHLKSESKIYTDAPIDNNGKGQNFSPTDLVAAALGSCMITIVGIRALAKNIEIGKPSYSIRKIMGSNPRKISKIEVQINFPSSINLKDREYLEKEALKCPVALSLNTDLVQDVRFSYN